MRDDHAFTPPAIARRYGVNTHKVLGWIARGELVAVNVGDGAKRPRWRITPDALADFERRRAAQPKLASSRRKKKKAVAYTEYF